MFDGSWQQIRFAGANPVERAVKAAVQFRNNLFHGGKHHVSRGTRDRDLVHAALLVVRAVIEAEPGRLKEEYNAGAA
jgi:hypothetical protein